MTGFLRCLSIAAAVVLTGATQAQAGPLAGALGLLVSGGGLVKVWAVLGSTVFGAALQQTVLGLALSSVSRLFRKDPAPRGVLRRVEFGGDRPQRVLLGNYATAGHLVWTGSHGKAGKTPNAYLTDVILLSVLPIDGLSGIQVNGAKVELGETAHPDYGLPVLDFRVKNTDYLWIKVYDGTQTIADPMLVAKYAADLGTSDDYPWDADMIGLGCAYAIITARGNTELFGGQPPQVLFETRGTKLYDMRRDGTAGGSGSQRFDDPATWEFSANPKVALYTVLTAGLSFSDQHLYGPRWPQHTLPAAQWLAAINACDVEVAGQDDEPEPNYRFGCDLDLSMPPRDFAREMLKVSSADFAICEGKALVHVGAASAPIALISDADCSVSHPQELEPFKGLEEVFNTASATFPDPAQTWSMVPAPTTYHPDWELEDGGRRVATMPYPYVPWVSQVQRLVETALKDQRRQKVHRVVLHWRLAHLAPLDYVAWTSARNSYDAKVFKVVSVTDHATGHVEALLLEEDPDDYDPPDLLPHDPTPPGRVEIPAQTLTDFAVAAHTLTNGSSARPAILCSWDPEAADDARGLRIALRLAGDTGDGDEYPLQQVSPGRAVISDGILPATGYQVRAILDVERATEWTDWVSVTSPAVYFGDLDLGEGLRNRIDEAFDNHDRALADADGLVAELRARLEQILGVSLVPDSPQIPGIKDIPGIEDIPGVPPGAFPGLSGATVPRLRSLDAALGDLEMALASLVGLIDENRRLVTDAGIAIDPETGRVRIYGLQVTEERIASLEIDLNAALAELSLRVTTAELNQAITEALLDPSQLLYLADIEARLTLAEITLSSQGVSLSALVLDVNDQEIRLGTAELRLTGAEALISAAQTTIDDQGTRLADAEIQISALDIPGINFTVQSTFSSLTREELREMALADEVIRRGLGIADLEKSTASARFEITAWAESEFAASSQARLDLSASIAGVSAGLITEQQARADADGALAALITALTATVGTNTAGITTESVARADADSALAAQITALNATVGDNTAGLSVEQQARADADSALAAQITALNASVGDNTAGLSVEQQTRADADSALAAQITALNATVGDNTAGLSVEIVARADADSALSAQITTLTATVDDNTAAITAESVARADADSAFAAQMTSLTATVDQHTAGIAWLNGVKVDADGAVAAVNQVISAEYGDLLAMAEATAFAEATIDGIKSGFVWKLGGDDILSLIEIDDGVTGPVTTARIKADYIVLNGNTEVDGTFLATHIAAYSATIADARIGAAVIDWAQIENVAIGYGEISGALQSANYAAGVSGFRIDAATGVIEATEVIDRSALTEGATFDTIRAQALGNFARAGYAGDNVWTEVIDVEFTPATGEAWEVSISGENRTWHRTQPNPNAPPATLFYTEIGGIRATRQFKKVGGDAWSAKSPLTTLEITDVNDTAWRLYNFSELFSGVFAAIRYSIEIRRDIQDGGYVFAPGDRESMRNHRDMQIIVYRKVK